MNTALARALDEASGRFPDAVALSGSGLHLTYASLGDHATSLGGRLRANGLETAEPVHVKVSNHPLDLVALAAVWHAGGVAVPVHRTTPAAVVAQLTATTGARWTLDLIATPDPLAPPGRPAPAHRESLRDAALVIFTSGSTGRPKGVVVSHEAFHGKMLQIDRLLGFRPDETTLLVLNITFSFGLWVSLLTLMRGGRLVMHGKFAPDAFLRDLAAERPARTAVVPTMMRSLFAQAGLAPARGSPADAPALRQLLIGGESLGRSLAADIRAMLPAADVIDIYGLTETSTCDFFAFPRDARRYPGCIGRAAPNVDYRIVDDHGRVVPDGATGELQIRSPYLMRGYLDEPELTRAAFDGDWLRTGDIARCLDREVVELMGRSKELISRGGNKVTPVEIEQALCAHPDIAAAMAVGVADPLLGERIHALVVPRAGTAFDPDAVATLLQDTLERFKHPDAYYVLDALPLGRTGKSDRGQFRSLVESGAIAPVATRA